MAGTLSAAIPSAGSSPAILIPCKPQPITFSFDDLHTHVLNFQTKLSQLGITPHDAVSITLPASYEFIVAFLAITKQRSIAAPLNPAYTQDEFKFYIGDLRPSLLLIPKGSYEQHELAVRAACRYKAAIAECCWNGQEVALNLKEPGTMTSTRVPATYEAFQDDIALVLHTSGTTGLPKAVNPPTDSTHFLP